MATRMTISFKNTTKDMKLYSYIISQEEISDFIKKSVEFYINSLEVKNESNTISK